MARALLALGANLGDRAATLAAAVEQLGARPEVACGAVSRWWATQPAGGPAGQGEFLNGAVIVETSLSPETLLDWLQEIERRAGRVRTVPWGPRVLDIDLLLYDDRIVQTHRLEVPHRRLAYRRFVLDPAAEIAAEWRHPRIGWTIGQLAEHARTSPFYLAVTGPDRERVESIVADVVAQVGGDWLRDPAQSPADVHERQVRRRAQLSDAARQPRERLRISDYWFDEPNPAEVVDAVGVVDGGRDEVVMSTLLIPRLVVLIESPDSLSAVECARWRVAVERPGRGPWLILAGAEREACVAELVGAVAALS
ncbi:MAG: 2-amino-4-hydroxy-6-hydroxymethyldihydropteridine diphosphokinase [Pirellulales bacterium]